MSSSTSAEKLVKYTIKFMAKTYDIDYSEAKNICKKVLKMSQKFDTELLGLMEDLLDLGNVGSVEELAEFDPQVLRMYCQIKDLEPSSEKKLVETVWNCMQEEYELESESDSEDSESESDSEDSDSESESESEAESGTVPEPVVIPKEPEPVKKKKVKVIE